VSDSPAPPPYVPGHGLLAGKTVLVTAAAGTGIGFAVAPFVAGPLYGFDPRIPLLICAVAAPFLIVLILAFERRVVRPAMAALEA